MRIQHIEAELIHEQRSDARLVRELLVPKDLLCWPGHFPGQEIVPGVVQLDWVIQAIADWTRSCPVLLEILELKFRALILPGQALTLEIAREERGQFRFALRGREAMLASGRVLLACEPAP